MFKKRFSNRWQTGGAVALLLLLPSSSGCFFPVQAEPVVVESFAEAGQPLFCVGYVDHRRGVLNLHSPLPARVTDVLVEENQEVQEGDLLFLLDDTQARYELESAEAACEVAAKQLDYAQATNSQQLAVAIFQQKLRLAERHRKLAQAKLDEYQVKAPCAGTVVRSFVQPGDWLMPASGQPAMQICPEGKRIVRVEISQEFSHDLVLGRMATFHDEFDSQRDRCAGRVIFIADWFTSRRTPPLEPTGLPSERTVECLIELVDPPASLRLGQRLQGFLLPHPDPALGKSGVAL